MIREVKPKDKAAILRLVVESEQFDEAGVEHVEQTLGEHFSDPSHSIWLAVEDEDLIGVAYCAPEPVTDGTWNLLMLWLKKGREGQGHGSALVREAEDRLRQREARLLIVETSGTPEFEGARRFYTRCGFTKEAAIEDFFAAGDAKIIFTKSLSA